MERAHLLFLGEGNTHGFLQKALATKTPLIPDETVTLKFKEYSRLFGLLDAIWSSVRGIDSGLLPNDQDIKNLDDALTQAKTLWVAMNLTTLQPKWHLTFDGHLLSQYKKFGGLADKSDETIEKAHQTLKELRDRYRRITSYEARETCIRRELRRSRSPEILNLITKFESLTKKSAGSKRALDTATRQEDIRKAKKEKRENYIVTL